MKRIEEAFVRFDEFNDRHNGWPLAIALLIGLVGIFWTAARR